MDARRRLGLTNVALFVLALGHALLTWPLGATVALFAGGLAVAFVLEAAGVRSGLLRHHLRPRVAAVPLPILLAWPAVVYVAYRVARLVLPSGAGAAALAAVLATAADVVADPRGVEAGAWEYPDAPVSEPRFRGVPWWNFAAWLAVVFVTSLLPAAVGT